MIRVKKITELTGHNGALYSLEDSEIKDCIFSGGSDKIIAKWNLGILQVEKFTAQLPGIIYSLCYIEEKKILLVGTSEGKIHVIDLLQKREIKTLQNHIGPVFDIKYNTRIISVGGDGVLSITAIENFNTISLVKVSSAKLRMAAILGDSVAIACGDGAIRIIDLNTSEIKNEFHAHTGSVYSLKFSPDGKRLFSGGKDAHLNIWELFRENWVKAKSIPAHNYAIYSIVFSPDGKYFATASRDKTIKIWSTNTSEVLVRIDKEQFNGHINSVNKLLWNKYNNYLISTGDDRKIMVWEII
jgi:WD40 repeat protein